MNQLGRRRGMDQPGKHVEHVDRERVGIAGQVLRLDDPVVRNVQARSAEVIVQGVKAGFRRKGGQEADTTTPDKKPMTGYESQRASTSEPHFAAAT